MDNDTDGDGDGDVALTAGYGDLVAHVNVEVRPPRVRAARVVNVELIALSWPNRAGERQPEPSMDGDDDDFIGSRKTRVRREIGAPSLPRPGPLVPVTSLRSGYCLSMSPF